MNTALKTQLESKLFEITIQVNNFISNNISLYYGATGVALLNFEAFLYFKNIEINKLLKLINDKIYDFIYTNKFDLTFGNGLAGFAWYLNYLQKKGVYIDKKVDFDKELYDLFFENIKYSLAINNLSLINGAIGGGVFFKSINNQTLRKKYLSTLIVLLNKKKIISKNGITWKSLVYNKNTNFGLYNGLPGIIFLLLNIYQMGINKSICKNLIIGGLSFIISFQNGNSLSILPSLQNRKGSFTRLALCYGDLLISYLMLLTATTFDLNKLRNNAIQIALRTIVRKSVQETFIYDAGLSYGTSGVALLYYKIYMETNIITFKEASEYWHKKTLEYCNEKGGIAGCLTVNKLSNKAIKKVGLLEGVVGIGLSFLFYLNNGENTHWDKCLLLNKTT